MTTDERQQLAALEATVHNEFGHITKRLDSHSADIRTLTDCVRKVEQKVVGISENAGGGSEAVKARLIDRQMLWNIIIALVTAAVTFGGAYVGINK